jgi:hypothetical protein
MHVMHYTRLDIALLYAKYQDILVNLVQTIERLFQESFVILK